mmetsp:Transcript_6938/g.17082  ORF Transcript_6938/g.17082 Transcript_6938/m.17082 type:complete len:247 (-) Transcript_6938:13-753(-)
MSSTDLTADFEDANSCTSRESAPFAFERRRRRRRGRRRRRQRRSVLRLVASLLQRAAVLPLRAVPVLWRQVWRAPGLALKLISQLREAARAGTHMCREKLGAATVWIMSGLEVHSISTRVDGFRNDLAAALAELRTRWAQAVQVGWQAVDAVASATAAGVSSAAQSAEAAGVAVAAAKQDFMRCAREVLSRIAEGERPALALAVRGPARLHVLDHVQRNFDRLRIEIKHCGGLRQLLRALLQWEVG